MQYGDEKVRDMMRSLLPSTSRRTSRENAASVKRRNRRRTRQALAEWKGWTDPYEFTGHIYDYGDTPAVRYSIKDVMWERRDADNTAAFIRWATAKTKHLDDPFERYAAIKKLTPDNLIGRHALSHLRWVDGFDFGDVRAFYALCGYRRCAGGAKEPAALSEVQVREVIAMDLEALNRCLKASMLPVCAGLGDVEFIRIAMSQRYSMRAAVVRSLMRGS